MHLITSAFIIRLIQNANLLLSYALSPSQQYLSHIVTPLREKEGEKKNEMD